MTAPLTARAARHATALSDHYAGLERFDALRNLAAAIDRARADIPNITAHRTAPAAYPQLARPGTGWTKFGRYWFVYGTRPPHAIRAIIYESANLPRRL